MKKLFIYSLLLLSTLSVVIIACQKGYTGAEKSKARLQVFLTDAPGDFEAVYIDVKDVMINVTGDTTNGWKSLSGVKASVYDLMKLTNDKDTLLADAEIPSGKLHQIRLVLGTENYVKIEGTPQLLKLETPSAQQSGLKLKIQQDVVNGVLYTILLDFDVAKSIHKTGSNKYMLKPVIRTVLQAVGGSIKGVVMPISFQTAIYAVQGPDTIASTFTGTNGGYFFKGLTVGSYALHYNPSDITYKDSIRNNISVLLNKVTVVDTTVLKQ